MSRAGHVRRRHAVARPHSWAIGPDTAACLFAVACAVLLVPLAMGGRHPLGQVFLSGAAIAAAVAFAAREQLSTPVLPERVTSGWHRSSRRLPI